MTKKEKLINLTDEKNKKELTKQEKFILSLEEKARKGKNKEKNKKSYSKFKQEKKEDEIEKSFRMISKITPQKRKKRYNIFIDGDFAFGVDEEVLLKFNLSKGIHVSKELQDEIESEESYYKAYQRTLNYLTYSLRSEKQIRDYLKKHDAEQFSDRMVEHFKDLKLIDDLNYAESYVRTMANINRKGPRNIERDLEEKGIADNEKMIALEEYPHEQQVENAEILAKKRWGRSKKDSRVEGIQKVKQYLVNKGYSFEIADIVIEQMDTDVDEEAEYAALVKQGDRAIRRYSRKHEGYELVQRLKRYLYSKSFPSELINRFIDERNL
ncbi:MAG: recombination regulator RecX [Atopostipes suicloacalis]|nr:recombination regulator RecX [Atopostipes suicloacalis]